MKTINELVVYFERMDHGHERLAVLPEQFAPFIEALGDGIKLEIFREGGISYIRRG
jgi:hypothetical protein